MCQRWTGGCSREPSMLCMTSHVAQPFSLSTSPPPSASRPEATLRQYLVSMTDIQRQCHRGHHGQAAFISVEDFTASRGQSWCSSVMTPDQVDAVKRSVAASRCQLRQRECFYNAQRVVLADRSGRLAYAEGMALPQCIPFPVHHGWIVVDGSVVVDLTWRKDAPSTGVPKRLSNRIWGEHNSAYIGSTFPRDAVLDYMLENKALGSLLDDPKRGWPYLKGSKTITLPA